MLENMKKMEGIEEIQPLIDKALSYQNLGYGTTFINIYGHTASVGVSFFPYGWSSGSDPSLSISMYLSPEYYAGDGFTFEEEIKRNIDKIDKFTSSQLTVEEYEKEQKKEREYQDRLKYEELKAKYEK